MKNILYTFILLFSSSHLLAQVDYDGIKSKTSDKNSEFYYEKLVERFKGSDSTLTKEHFTALYYGAVFLPSYQVDLIDDAEAKIREANYAHEHLRAYELADSLLNIYPASVQAYFEKAFACFNLKRFEEETYNNKRYKVLVRAIMNSGDGKSLSTAWHANLPNDEFEVIRYIEGDIKEESELESNDQLYDFFDLKGKTKMKKVVFNVTMQAK